jgi:hypothetical protein
MKSTKEIDVDTTLFNLTNQMVGCHNMSVSVKNENMKLTNRFDELTTKFNDLVVKHNAMVIQLQMLHKKVESIGQPPEGDSSEQWKNG